MSKPESAQHRGPTGHSTRATRSMHDLQHQQGLSYAWMWMTELWLIKPGP